MRRPYEFCCNIAYFRYEGELWLDIPFAEFWLCPE